MVLDSTPWARLHPKDGAGSWTISRELQGADTSGLKAIESMSVNDNA